MSGARMGVGLLLALDLLKEATAITVASRAMAGSGPSRAVDPWLPQGSLPDTNTLRTWADPSGVASDSALVSACRRYAWRVANAAYTISEEQIRELPALGLADAKLLNRTLAAALFSTLAILSPISAAVAPNTDHRGTEVATKSGGQVQSALREELAV